MITKKFSFLRTKDTPEILHPSPKLAGGASLVFLLLALWVAHSHEMWRDEAQGWMIAVESSNLWELWLNTGQEGHPMMWHALLWPLATLGAPIFSMQVLQACIGALGVWVIFRHSPFSHLEKIGICLGYYFFYEWTIIARNYLCGVVFLWLALSQWQERESRSALTQLRFYLPLAFSAAFNIFSLAIACAVGVCCLFEVLKTKQWKSILGLNLLAFIGVVTGYSIVRATLHPQSFAQFRRPVLSLDLFERVFQHFAESLIYRNVSWWSDARIGEDFVPLIKIVSAAGAIAFVLLALKRRELSLFFFTSVTLCYGVLFGVANGGARHSAFVWVIAFCLLWFVRVHPQWKLDLGRSFVFKVARLSFLIGLLSQLYLNYLASRAELRFQFSSARAAADLIEQHAKASGFKNYTLAALTDWSATPIAAYLGKAVFTPYRMQEEFFVRWGERKNIDPNTALQIILEKIPEYKMPVYFTSNTTLHVPSPFTKIGAAENSSLWDERYSIYLYSPVEFPF